MVNRILYLHGADDGGGPDDLLARELRTHWPETEIVAPQLPSADLPDAADQWQHEVGRAIRELPDEPWVLVGHSLGGSEALRFLCLRVPTLLRRTIIVGAPLWEAEHTGAGPDHPWWGPQWALPARAGKILADADVVIVHSEEDPVVPVDHAYRLARLLPSSRMQIAHDGGHMPTDWVRRAV
ncbi:hypothetical protein FCK90_09940 [Kocuria coralli]|uniref:Alpha/beta fold hydrolase n=1 Tax=Kocuria coralli TaxID=1461025 RepID=A0A5J5KXF4_9MICC|nr:alpha/beta fold hydrolase [Kocuria coralli]KAA9393970.1 hypothetical protein FCK90_09940 [Kocuria coralli]